MIRDMMVQCIETRFDAIRAPHPVQWWSDNGSIFAAHRTIEIALALNLAPCFTPVESPESNGMAEAFVKTFKRDYVRISPIPNASVALALIDGWMEDYNTVHRIPAWATAHRGSTSFLNQSRVRLNGVNSRGVTPWSADFRKQEHPQCHRL
jgi:transposase InsO family protein